MKKIKSKQVLIYQLSKMLRIDEMKFPVSIIIEDSDPLCCTEEKGCVDNGCEAQGGVCVRFFRMSLSSITVTCKCVFPGDPSYPIDPTIPPDITITSLVKHKTKRKK